jgi:hypothetical protein
MDNKTPINISKGSKGGYVQQQLIKCMQNIIFKIKNEFDIEYEDVTYKDLYIKTVQFAKEVDEILSAEITQVDNVFHSTPDFNSFKNDKLV